MVTGVHAIRMRMGHSISDQAQVDRVSDLYISKKVDLEIESRISEKAELFCWIGWNPGVRRLCPAITSCMMLDLRHHHPSVLLARKMTSRVW